MTYRMETNGLYNLVTSFPEVEACKIVNGMETNPFLDSFYQLATGKNFRKQYAW